MTVKVSPCSPLPGLCLCWCSDTCRHRRHDGTVHPIADVDACARTLPVCKSVLGQIDAELTVEMRKDVEVIEKHMRKWCDSSKGKDKTMCYYMGVGDAEQGTSGGVKRDISSSFSRGINAKRLCNRLKAKDGQVRYSSRRNALRPKPSRVARHVPWRCSLPIAHGTVSTSALSGPGTISRFPTSAHNALCRRCVSSSMIRCSTRRRQTGRNYA